jgi:hypothetical protein
MSVVVAVVWEPIAEVLPLVTSAALETAAEAEAEPRDLDRLLSPHPALTAASNRAVTYGW